MILKKIEMVGFKSFADRTVIDFTDSFTAIVGPNGCGKSNVSDAIRWVLGEQRVKDLRADSMQDVIFNGTEKRKSLSYCEVSLHFDNSTRYFNFNYDELIITRKLYRSGESEYLLNKNPCLLRDIQNILYNSGLGKTGYSIVGQGKVAELVDAKPESRRAMFEDAAGISKYKKDKTDAERKLGNTRDNLSRVKDILFEIERQMGPLKKQAENAKKYLELKSVLKDLEVNAYIFQYENANDVKAKINLKLQAIMEELGFRQNEYDVTNEEYNKVMDSLSGFDNTLASINNQILELTVGLEKQEGETKVARERIIFTQKENDRLNLDVTNAKTAIKLGLEQKERKEIAVKNFQDNLEALNKSYDQLSEQYSALARQISLSESETGESQQKFIETLGSISDVKSLVSRLLAEKEYFISTKENLDKQILEATSKKDNFTEIVREFEANSKKAEDELKEVNNSVQELNTKIYLGERRIKEIESEKANTTTQMKVFQNRRKLLVEMQADYEGYAHSVKKILKESERNSELRSNMVGVVASLIKVPEKFETAIEVALGNALQNIITFDEDGAKKMIAYLKQNSYGRATFLPITTMKRRDIDKSKIVGRKNCYGVASSLIDYDSKIDNVISNLLGATVIVEDLQTAVEMAKDTHFSFKIVTLEGDVVNPQGSMTGGSKKAEAVNLINREREIVNLANEIDKLYNENIKLENELKLAVEKLVEDRKKVQELFVKKDELTRSFTADNSKLLSVKDGLKDIEQDLDGLLNERQTIENKLTLNKQELEKSQRMESALSGNKEDVNILIQEKKEKYENLRKELEVISSNLTTVKVEVASVKTQLESAENENVRIENEIGILRTNLLKYEAQLQANNEFIENAERMIKQKIESAPSSAVKRELEALKERQVTIQNEKQVISNKIKELDEKRTSLMEEISRANDKKYREEMNLSKVDTDIEIMQERIFEEYSLVYSQCLEFKRPDFDFAEASPKIGKIKREISALGPINVNAIEDVSALLERYNTLKEQADDLEKAESDLTKIIKDLSDIMIEKFLNELNQINESFKITFRELFNGGTAKLELSDPENPLESGVEVFVQPPGKKVQSMSLYSGGEKSLTAMAMIFAILRNKPLPFCLFDEVEAALDDSNVEIVDKYLKKLSNETQFILITHKKPTMEHADSLFGVTMEEKGVSKIVSVKLADAIKQAEENK